MLHAQNVGIGTNTPSHPLTIQTGHNYGLVHKGVNTWVGTYTDNGYGWMGSITDHPFHLGTSEAIHATFTTNGNFGIGTPTPQAPFTVAAGKTVLLGNDTMGGGTKLMWIPSKGAFRAGKIEEEFATPNNDDLLWNPDSIGINSVAMGYNVLAKGDFSFASGFRSQATGYKSTALGQSWAKGPVSTSMGLGTAVGLASVATGFYTQANGHGSLVAGYYNDTIVALANDHIPLRLSEPMFIVGNGNGIGGDPRRFHNAMVVYYNGNADLNGFVRLGEITDGAPRIKTKKITGYNTPGSANPNTFTFVPHGIANANKILSISVLVTDGNYQLLPHSTEAGLLYTVNTDPTGGGAGPGIAVGVKSLAQSSSVMGKPIKILIVYEE